MSDIEIIRAYAHAICTCYSHSAYLLFVLLRGETLNASEVAQLRHSCDDNRSKYPEAVAAVERMLEVR